MFLDFFFYVVDERLKQEDDDLPNMNTLSIDLQKQIDSQKDIQGMNNYLFTILMIVKKIMTDFK